MESDVLHAVVVNIVESRAMFPVTGTLMDLGGWDPKRALRLVREGCLRNRNWVRSPRQLPWHRRSLRLTSSSSPWRSACGRHSYPSSLRSDDVPGYGDDEERDGADCDAACRVQFVTRRRQARARRRRRAMTEPLGGAARIGSGRRRGRIQGTAGLRVATRRKGDRRMLSSSDFVPICAPFGSVALSRMQ